MGRLDRRGLLPLVESAHRSEWSGVIRLRHGRAVGAVWTVKGHVVHALRLEDGVKTEGVSALESLATWREGTYFLEVNVLPPARTVRLGIEVILASLWRLSGGERAKHVSSKSDASRRVLSAVLQNLRERVPGLESLSLSRGSAVEATTASDTTEREWLNGQVRRYCDDGGTAAGRLLLQDGDHALLIVKKGCLAAVLFARGATTPEALWWAGEEARKAVLDRCHDAT